MDIWSYDKEKRVDKKGNQWHFMSHHLDASEIPYEERPFELYFRDDARTVFGLLRFERRKENPYRDYNLMVRKIMNDAKFRGALLNPETEEVWKGR
jgi:hypothetical protein